MNLKQSHQLLLASIVILSIFTSEAIAQALSLEWANSYGNTGDERGRAITYTPSGEIITTGDFKGTVDFDPSGIVLNINSNGDSDTYIQKLSASGNLIWVKTFGGTGEDLGRGITLDKSGNIIVIGRFQGTVDFDPGISVFNISATATKDIFILKLDAAGNFLWAKTIVGSPASAWNDGRGVVVDNQDNIIITGNFQGTVDLDPGTGNQFVTSNGYADIYCMKLDPSGNMLWAHNFGSNDFDHARDVDIDDADNIYITGRYSSTIDFDPGPGVANRTSNGDFDIFVLKLNKDGIYQWVGSVGHTGGDFGEAIHWNGGNRIFVTGRFQGTVDFDPSLGTYLLNAAGGDDIYVMELDVQGAFINCFAIGGSGDEWAHTITTNSAGEVLIAGYYEDVCDFDPSPAAYSLTSQGDFDIFIANYTPSGTLNWAETFGGLGLDIVKSMKINSSNEIIVTGGYTDIVDFDPTSGIYNLTSSNGEDSFVAKYESILTSLPGNNSAIEVQVYPNPTTSQINITLDKVYPEVQLELIDARGRVILARTYHDLQSISCDTDLAAGHYSLRIFSGTTSLYGQGIVLY